MGKVRKGSSSSKAKDKGVLRPSSSKGAKSKPTSTKSSSISKKGKEPLRAAVASSGKSKVTTGKPTTVPKPSSNHKARVLSDEESQDDSEVEDEDEAEEDPDHQLGLRPTLRVVSKATVKKTWKPISVKTRTHIQSLVSSLFPAVISQSRGEKKKIAVQATLSRLMEKMNDRLSDLPVPPAGKDRANYSQLAVRNRELEAMLVPDLEHIRDLELRLEQEQILAAQDEEQLENFREKKRALDIRTNQLHRAKLHPLLRERDNSLQTAITHLCESEKDFSHLSAADQRLMAMMPLSRDEDFSQADVRDTMYNPDQDPRINKISKRMGNRLAAIERNGEGLDPLMQLIAAAQNRVQELSSTTLNRSNNT
ncbi:hypothetical protein BGZ80_003213 [Entomortierella chlamydospora]|uniref:Kinetochore protein fta7 n=1 Tax=Entomortierella chlamydospora TaxID=101097 RepID=A0A9P6T2Y1_9FUNG|nr:hypothetical protein BGZ80_003213 [Entomortierella chlamydospora]